MVILLWGAVSFRYLLEESYSSIESIIVKILLDEVLHIRKNLKRMLVMLSTYDNTKKFYCQADVKATFNSQVHEWLESVNCSYTVITEDIKKVLYM